MTRKNLDHMMNRLRVRHGIALRLIESLPESKLHEHPIPNMRTPAEMVVHLYGMAIRELMEGTQRGEVREIDEAAIVKTIRTNADLLAYASASFEAASRAAVTLTDAQLAATVKTSWGKDVPASLMVEAVIDEFYHHRGQLYAYARALGVTPPDMYDFANNAPEFQPASAPASS